jgi:hypothetical protein
MLQRNKKKYFLMVSDYFSYKIGPIDLVLGLIFKLTCWDIHSAHLQGFVYVWGIMAPPNGLKKAERPTGGPVAWPKV